MSSRLWFILPLLTISSCRKPDTDRQATADSVPPVSYQNEVRDILANNCLQCHSPASPDTSDSPEAAAYRLKLTSPQLPDSFSFPHPGDLTEEKQEILLRWISEGQKIDPHWTTKPLPKAASGKSIDSFFPQITTQRTEPRETSVTPDILSPEELRLFIAGDYLEHPEATHPLRKAPDAPASRATMVSEKILGLQLDCARCHHHPTEEISPDDFTQFTQLFTHSYDGQPTHPLKPPTTLNKLSPPPQLDALKTSITERIRTGENTYQEWLQQPDRLPIITDLTDAYSFNSGRLFNLALGEKLSTSKKRLRTSTGIHREALALEGEETLRLSDQIRQTAFTPVTYALWFRTTSQNHTILSHGISLSIRGGHLQATLSRYWPGNAIGIKSSARIATLNRWNHLTLTYDGSRTSNGLTIYLNGKALATKPIGTTLSGPVAFRPLTLGGTGDTVLLIDEFSRYLRALTHQEIQHLVTGKSLLENTPGREFFFSALDSQARQIRQKIASLRAHHYANEGQDELSVMEPLTFPKRESPHPAIHAFNHQSRLELANNLTESRLARIAVNQIWHAQFGEFLAPQGMGPASARPEKVEILNHLAARLIQGDWSEDLIIQEIQASTLYQSTYPEEKVDAPICPRPILMKPKRNLN